MKRVHALVAMITLSLVALPSCRGDTKGGQVGAGPGPLIPDTLCATPGRERAVPRDPPRGDGDAGRRLSRAGTRHADALRRVLVAELGAATGRRTAAGNPLPGGFADHPEAPRVWEGWIDASTLFWGDSATGPCAGQPGRGRKILFQMAKNGHVVNPHASFDEAVGGPLLDVNINFALFEKKLSPDEERYVRDSSLVTVQRAGGGRHHQLPAGLLCRRQAR